MSAWLSTTTWLKVSRCTRTGEMSYWIQNTFLGNGFGSIHVWFYCLPGLVELVELASLERPSPSSPLNTPSSSMTSRSIYESKIYHTSTHCENKTDPILFEQAMLQSSPVSTCPHELSSHPEVGVCSCIWLVNVPFKRFVTMWCWIWHSSGAEQARDCDPEEEKRWGDNFFSRNQQWLL